MIVYHFEGMIDMLRDVTYGNLVYIPWWFNWLIDFIYSKSYTYTDYYIYITVYCKYHK